MKIIPMMEMDGLFIQLSQVNIGDNIVSKIPDEMPCHAFQIRLDISSSQHFV